VRDHVSLITQISRGLIREQRTRRLLMFYGLIAALVMLFIGSVIFSWLREHPLLFLFYWGACAWITLLAMLLAIFDLLMVRAAAKSARRQLEHEYLEDLRRKNRHDPDPPGTRGA
jgi:MFS family permease